MVSALRQLIRGVQEIPDPECGIPIVELRGLVERMTSCSYGALFYDLNEQGHLAIDSLMQLVIELNSCTRFVSMPMAPQGDISGISSLLCWQTGFPSAVDFSRGYPRYSPGEFSAQTRLARKEADACLISGSESVSQLSPAARGHLASIPTIVLDSPDRACPFVPTVRFSTAIFGLHVSGSASRMDHVALPLRPLCTSEYPHEEDVLRQIQNATFS
jgi:formylmethanofuran dehydrogenase subunit B